MIFIILLSLHAIDLKFLRRVWPVCSSHAHQVCICNFTPHFKLCVCGRGGGGLCVCLMSYFTLEETTAATSSYISQGHTAHTHIHFDAKHYVTCTHASKMYVDVGSFYMHKYMYTINTMKPV